MPTLLEQECDLEEQEERINQMHQEHMNQIRQLREENLQFVRAMAVESAPPRQALTETDLAKVDHQRNALAGRLICYQPQWKPVTTALTQWSMRNRPPLLPTSTAEKLVATICLLWVGQFAMS